MKKLMIALFLFAGVAFSQQANAQVSVNINIGSQPAWGPSGYNHADFYYIPSINCYYDITRGQYVYMQGTRWIYAPQLLPRYRGFDLYRSYKVVINQPNAYRYNRAHMTQYARYKNNYNQPMNRDNRDYRNYVNGRNNHNDNHGNGNGYANGNGNGHDNNGNHGNNGHGNGNNGHGNNGNNGHGNNGRH